MNTANKLTMLRVALIPVFLVALYAGFAGSRLVATGIFVIASLTDFVDGYIARSRRQVTDFGKFMDPLADKALVFSAILWFTESGVFPAWAALAILIREFAVTGLRLVAADGGHVIAAGKLGKLKTASTMVCLIIMFIGLPAWANAVCVVVILVTTVVSGVEYFIKNKNSINSYK